MKNVKMLIRFMCCCVAFCFLLSLSGCASVSMAKRMSAGQVGCPPDNITIENYDHGLVSSTWTAKCEGKTYYCTRYGDSGANCKEKK